MSDRIGVVGENGRKAEVVRENRGTDCDGEDQRMRDAGSGLDDVRYIYWVSLGVGFGVSECDSVDEPS